MYTQATTNQQLTPAQADVLRDGLITYTQALPKLLSNGDDRNGLAILNRLTTALQALVTLLTLKPVPEVMIQPLFRTTLVPAFNELEIHMRAVWRKEQISPEE